MSLNPIQTSAKPETQHHLVNSPKYAAVTKNISCEFKSLIDKNFTPRRKCRKIFRSNLRMSYSCPVNLKS